MCCAFSFFGLSCLSSRSTKCAGCSHVAQTHIQRVSGLATNSCQRKPHAQPLRCWAFHPGSTPAFQHRATLASLFVDNLRFGSSTWKLMQSFSHLQMTEFFVIVLPIHHVPPTPPAAPLLLLDDAFDLIINILTFLSGCLLQLWTRAHYRQVISGTECLTRGWGGRDSGW